MSCGLENRDYDTLLRAAREVDATFRIYAHGFFGSGNEKPLSPANVEWLPRVSFDELRDAYASCDAVILPINNVDYAAGVTGLVEAMSAGKPIITSGSKGIEEYTRFLDQRFIARPGDHDSMAKAANSLLSQPDRGHGQGVANREWVLQNCALDKYIQMIKVLMES
jgi:glycosyltransferase involved in cell wall biosynthesis